MSEISNEQLSDFITILGVAWVVMGLIIPFFIQYARDSLREALEEIKGLCPCQRRKYERWLKPISLYFIVCDTIVNNAIITVFCLSIFATLAFIVFPGKILNKSAFFGWFCGYVFLSLGFQLWFTFKLYFSRVIYDNIILWYALANGLFLILYEALTFNFSEWCVHNFLKWLWIAVISWSFFYLFFIFYYGEKYKPTYNLAALMGENLLRTPQGWLKNWKPIKVLGVIVAFLAKIMKGVYKKNCVNQKIRGK
jgi:hypothetical protein